MSWAATKSDMRWCREFPSADTFSEDLGGLGESVGPRGGPSNPLQGQTEDYVLRRVLVALHRSNRLKHPLTICAYDQRAPDFVIQDGRGEWGLEITEAGSEEIQRRRSRVARLDECANEEHLVPLGQRDVAVANAIRKKIPKLNEDYASRPGFPKSCDLVVYDNCNAFSDIRDDLEKLRDLRDESSIAPSDRPAFREVLFVCEDGRTVYFDLLGSQQRVEIGGDYNIDFAEWVSEQVELLRAGKVANLDIEELTEELGALAKRDKRALRSHLQVLMHHLLKWQAQPDKRSSSWIGSIRNARDTIQGILEDSPSLWSELRDLHDVYDKARHDAAEDTGLSIDTFPQECPYVPHGEDLRLTHRSGSLQVLNREWLPD